jgi:voltage-gated potassium channel
MVSETPPDGPRGARRFSRPERPVAAPLRLADLERPQQRLAVMRCALTIFVAWALILGAFYVLPVAHESATRTGVRLGVDLALIAAVFIWQIRRIGRAELPELRAIEALGIVVAVFLVLFSSIYLSMSNAAASTFTQRLDPTRALYFTITVFSTVGFGDITPRTDQARLVVAVQMLLDFVIIGVAVRMLFNAARSRVTPAGGPAGSPEETS